MATNSKDFKVKNGLQVGGDGSFSGTVSVAYPTDPTHAATKQYVDENAGGGSGQFPDISDTFPESPVNGQLWLDSITGRLYIYYVDSTAPASSQWIELTYGSTGPSGLQGETGPAGPANTLTIGSVSSGPAAASITGTAPNQVLNLVIPTGSTGATGPANTLSIGTVTTGTAGSNASASITGTAPNQVLNLVLPRGATGNTGPANTLSIGTVTTGEAGTEAQAIISGTAPNQTLNFIIPRGAQGLQGLQGIPGPVGDLPDKTGNGGKLLTTDGSTASWSDTLAGPLLAQSFRPTSSTAPTNGMYLSASNTLAFSTNSTPQLTINQNGLATFAGRVSSTNSILRRTNTNQEGGQLTFNKAIDDTTGWAIDVFGSTDTPVLRFIQTVNSVASTVASINASGQLSATPAPGTTTTAATGVGYMGIPPSSYPTNTSVQLRAEDAGEYIYSTVGRQVNIPAGLPLGTTFVFISGPGATTTIGIISETLRLAGTGAGGAGVSRTLAPHGMATAVKVATGATAADNIWYISGNGLT